MTTQPLPTKLVNAIAKDVAWMLATSMTDGDYETRPARALRTLEKEYNLQLNEDHFNQVLAKIEW